MCVNMCVNMCMDMSTHAHRHVAIAEENSNKVLLAARSMELTETELNVYEALAKNPDVVVSDSTEKDFNLMLLADSVLGGTKKGGATSHQAILANLNVLRLASTAYGLRDGQTYIPDTSSISG